MPAGERLLQRHCFAWLDYARLGVLVDRVARGLLASGLQSGDAVAICGYRRVQCIYSEYHNPSVY